jgi:ferrous iron transport protein B
MDIKIALAGNPNSGKTTLFNQMTNSHEKVGNWSGVTVDKKEGELKGNKKVKVIDLPGIYGLSAKSADERVVIRFLRENHVDCFVNVVDGKNSTVFIF